jgi:hypothetical protein
VKRLVTIIIVLLAPGILFAQTYLDEDFSGAFPPTGWSVDSHPSNWSATASNNAGGTAPEVEFNWSPTFNGTSRLVSPEIDLTGVQNVTVEFKHMVDYYATPFTVGVATRSGGGSWNIVWQVSPSGNIPATTVTQVIDNNDVGAPDFQICWFFSGYSYNVDYWYIDDASLFQPLDHDVRTKEIMVDNQYSPGSSVSPAAVVENFGLNTETFDVSCDISMGGGVVYTDTVTSVTLGPGNEQTVNFTNYVASDPNELFEVVVSTHLAGDQNPLNDSKTDWFNTYTTPREMVVLEIGTGTWCQFCPGSAMGAEDLVANGHSVAVVEYHQGDNYQNPPGLDRIGYYGITGYPTAVFDGVEKFVGGSQNQSMYPQYLPIYQDRIVINSAFTMDIFGENVGNEYTITVRINRQATIPYQNLKLHVALTESDIPHNWFGLDHLDWVERIMIPGSGGTDIDMISNEVLDVVLNFTFDNAWDIQHCELAAFIQNTDDKEILQGTKEMILDLVPVGIEDNMEVTLPVETALKGNYPNPFNASTTIEYSLSEEQFVTIRLYDLLGREVSTLISGQLQAGDHSVTFDASDLSSGLYFYRMDTDKYSETRKMSLIK